MKLDSFSSDNFIFVFVLFANMLLYIYIKSYWHIGRIHKKFSITHISLDGNISELFLLFVFFQMELVKMVYRRRLQIFILRYIELTLTNIKVYECNILTDCCVAMWLVWWWSIKEFHGPMGHICYLFLVLPVYWFMYSCIHSQNFQFGCLFIQMLFNNIVNTIWFNFFLFLLII